MSASSTSEKREKFHYFEHNNTIKMNKIEQYVNYDAKYLSINADSTDTNSHEQLGVNSAAGYQIPKVSRRSQ